MTTAEHPSCDGCPLRGAVPFVPDTLVRLAPVVVLLDRVGDALPSDRLFGIAKLRKGTNVTVAHALRCEAGRRVRSGKRYEKALAACRAHDDFTGVRLIVCGGPVAWQALGLTEFGTHRGYVREVAG